MTPILTDYLINEQTLAMLSSYKLEYDTVILEENGMYFVKKPSFQLLKEACLTYGSSYDGRRKSVMHHTGWKRKVPIPVSICRNIYTFPTHAPSDQNCVWIFPQHIHSTQSTASMDSRPQSLIIFKNNQSITVDGSLYSIRKQIERIRLCRSIFSNP
jgi:competence protein ComK